MELLPIPIMILAMNGEEEQTKAAKIFETYHKLMVSVAVSILKDHYIAEDAASEAMIKIMRNLHKIPDIFCHQTRRYVVVIVENTAKTLLKKRGNLREDGDDALSKIPDKNPSPLESITVAEGVAKVARAIKSLPDTLADALILSVEYGHTAAEIAELLDITVDNAKQRVSRAKRAVRQMLEGEQNG